VRRPRQLGNEGYAEEADQLVRQYESVRFEDVHRPVLSLLPAAPSDVLDIGAGTGRDAAALAELGHRVVAVEPTAEFRERAPKLHPSPNIQWVNDHLPQLAELTRRAERFDAILVTAVWIHLDLRQRQEAMPTIAALLRPGGALLLNLRHGPGPPGRRRVFEISPEDTIALAAANGLRLIVRVDRRADFYGRPEVSWTSLGFSKLTRTRMLASR
jgi:protein-L-isoaspartate O-methyltransferase